MRKWRSSAIGQGPPPPVGDRGSDWSTIDHTSPARLVDELLLSGAMPYFSRRVLVSLSPFVNLDLFKKGYYHVTCRLVDEQASQNLSRVTCMGVKDFLGSQLSTFAFPGACVDGDCYVTQTVMVEYTDQSYPMGEWAVFSSEVPILRDHTEAFVASNFTLQLELRHCPGEEVPENLSKFTPMSTRNVSLRVDWRKGLHDHFPVVFDYFHMAAVGLTVHASLVEVIPDDFTVEPAPVPQKKWSFQPTQPARSAPHLPDLASVLFGQATSKETPVSAAVVSFPAPTAEDSSSSSSSPQPSSTPSVSVSPAVKSLRAAQYQVSTSLIQRGQEAHQMFCDIMHTARDSLCIGYAAMSGEGAGNGTREPTPPPDPFVGTKKVGRATSLDEAEEMCQEELHEMNRNLATTWEWFCSSAITHPNMITFLATRLLSLRLSFLKQTIVGPGMPFYSQTPNLADPVRQAVVAHQVRQSLQFHIPTYCRENVETPANASVVFIEPCPWATAAELGSSGGSRHRFSAPDDALPFGFTRHIQPYLLSVFPHLRKRRRRSVHLVVCVHGLQGNQFDLRLYRIYLSLALPHLRLDFLMAQSNQGDTFCDFNLMTDRLLAEVLAYIADMPTPPSRISFIGHSLGNIVVRSLVTRPEFSRYLPRLHLFFSICAPHLGTRLQNGIVSMGMWAVRKWYHSTSLLQLSLKDAANPRDSFLYHLSEAPSMESFRHVVLLSSSQDKYVPHHSAKLSSLSKDGSLQSTLSLEMMQNILEPLRERNVNLVRISVDHCIPTSANSLIGRAAHIAMLDSELFIEKLVLLHLVQYFVD